LDTICKSYEVLLVNVLKVLASLAIGAEAEHLIK